MMSKYFLKISAMLFMAMSYTVSADTDCDLNQFGDDDNSFSMVGATRWLEVIRSDGPHPNPIGDTEIRGQPCEFNLQIIDNNNDEFAYFEGIHTNANAQNHFSYGFSLKALDTMLSQLQPRQEVEFLTVGRRVTGDDKVLLSATIGEGKPGTWKVKLFWNPNPINDSYEVVYVPKVINNECQCAEIRFNWHRMLPQVNKYQVRIDINGVVRQKTLFHTAVPNLTKLGYISSNFDLNMGNNMYFGTIKYKEPTP